MLPRSGRRRAGDRSYKGVFSAAACKGIVVVCVFGFVAYNSVSVPVIKLWRGHNLASFGSASLVPVTNDTCSLGATDLSTDPVTCKSPRELLAHVDKTDPANVPNPWSEKQKARAYAPFGHVGAQRRLQAKIAKALGGEPLRIVVLGCSMTMGHGCPYKNDSGIPWPESMEVILRKTIPNAFVKNLALGGLQSSYVAGNADVIASNEPDVVVMDFAITDSISGVDGNLNGWMEKGLLQKSDFGSIHKLTISAIQTLLNLPTNPAVVYLETFTHMSLYGYGDCSHSVCQFPHWKILRDFNIPTISYSEAACNGSSTPPVTVWEDMYGGSRSPHCKCWVHLGVAHLMAGFFQQAFERVREDGIVSAQDHPRAAYTVDPFIECSLRPSTKYSARSMQIVDFPNISSDGDVWSLGEDRVGTLQGKPGWIAKNGTVGTVGFAVNVTRAVVIEYLMTYQNIGTARCWLDDGSFTLLDGRWNHSVSLSAFQWITFRGTSGGTHILRCQSDGRKFKIMGLLAC